MVAAVVASQPAVAQSANLAANPVLPPREELQAGAPPAAPAPPRPRTRLQVEGRIEHSPCALDDPKYAQIRIRLTAATFDGLGPVPESALRDTWQPYVGTDQPISVVCRIRDAGATALRSLGYIAAIEVPVQRIVDGQVHFAVLYAKVTSVRVIGRPGRDAGLLEAYLGKLVDGQVFNRFRAERSVLLAQDIPGYDLHLVLKPAGTGAGEMIAEVRVENTPVMADITVSDLASPSTGRWGGQLRAVFNGLTGMGDQTTLSAYSTSDFREQQIYQFGHQMQLGHDGLQLGGHVTYALTRPDLGPTVPPVFARTTYVNAELKYPLVRRQALTLAGTLGFDLVNQDVRFGGAALSRDRVRIAYARLDLDALDLDGRGPGGTVLWRVSANAELRHGLSILGASPNCRLVACTGIVPPGVANGDPQATVLRAGAEFDLRPLSWLSVALSPRVQVASAPVFAFEQFQLGNYTVGRGFDPGAILGDDGVAFSAELRGPAIRFAHKRGFTIQPYAFSDNGWTWRRLSPIPNPQELHSLGAGARVDVAGRARLDLTVAVPINTIDGEPGKRGALFLLTLSTQILSRRDQ
jgi:hemolysin activation/secretion protein